MHIKVPETVWIPYANDTFYNALGRVYLPWLTWPEEAILEKDSNSLYFSEKRRKTFSDVCHAKVERPEPGGVPDAFPGVKPVEFRGYPDLFIAGDTHVADGATSNAAWNVGRISSNGCFGIIVAVSIARLTAYGFRIRTRAVITKMTNKPSPTAMTASGTFVRSNTATVNVDALKGEWTRSWVKSKDDLGLAEYFCDIMQTCPLEALLHYTDPVPLIQWCKESVDRITPQVVAWRNHNPSFNRRGVTLFRATTVDPDLSAPFLLHEPEAIMGGIDDMLLGQGFEKYYRNVLVQHAYLDAIDHVPRASENSISNLLEITSFIKSLVIDRKVEIPKSLGDAWLAYRYSYGTTKLDAEEAISFVHRHMDLGDWKTIKSYGQHSLTYKGVLITCRCELEVSPRVVSTVKRVWRSLYTYGLSPGFYVIWDMIPYSFIVDWFVPIGDVMAAWDAEREFSQYYDVTNVNISLSYTRDIDGNNVKCYTRWLSTTPVPLQGYYFLEGTSASSRTVKKRVLDAASLLLG
jgi:hypothetical protein